MAQTKLPTLGPFPVAVDTSERLKALQSAVRHAGHAWPSQSLVVSALIHSAVADGRSLELDVLAPYRVAHPQEDPGD
jgi:hypothetical protein